MVLLISVYHVCDGMIAVRSGRTLIPFIFLCVFLNVQNYSSVATVHPEIIDGRPGTLVIESFVVDVPEGNTKDDTCYFVRALINCNLKCLAEVSERMAASGRVEASNAV